jgi:hypothetical protein
MSEALSNVLQRRTYQFARLLARLTSLFNAMIAFLGYALGDSRHNNHFLASPAIHLRAAFVALSCSLTGMPYHWFKRKLGNLSWLGVHGNSDVR